MNNILLDVNVVVDLCVERPGSNNSQLAIALARYHKKTLWLYVGSVQTLEYVAGSELYRIFRESGIKLSPHAARHKVRSALSRLADGFQWLAALSGEGDVFAEDDPEDKQLLRSLDRFPQGDAYLLTRDRQMLNRHPDCTITPEALIEFCRQEDKSASPAFVDLAAQQDQIRPALEKNIHTVLQHGKYILGPEVSELEGRLSEYTGCEHVVSCSSGTDALLMSLMALDVGPGDAVFTTPFTFVATADVIARLGATPVFVDIDPRTYNLDPDKLEQAIQIVSAAETKSQITSTKSQKNSKSQITNSKQTPSLHTQLTPKAVITVDLYGLPCDYDAINAVAQKYGLSVIQDAAQSFGAEYKDSICPTLGGIGCTSFFPSKPLGGYGDGGALFTDDQDLADKLRSIRVHGQGANKYNTVRLGLKGRLDTIQAAALLPKLDIYPRELEKRRKIAEQYTEMLAAQNPQIPKSQNSQSQNPSIQIPYEPGDRKSAWALYTLLARDTEHRQKLQAALKDQGIPTVIYYGRPLHLQPLFESLGYKQGDLPVAEGCASRCFSLPMHPYLSLQEQEYVASYLLSVIRNPITDP